MPEITPVSQERHARRTWQRLQDYQFAARDPVVVLTSQEVPRALMSMAMAFMESGGTQVLVAVQGLRPGQNKFVSPDGKWLGDYVPATYRSNPFKLARNQDGAEVLCIDELAGQVSESTLGEPFFLPDGTPAPAVAEVLQLLADVERDKQRTQNSCATLKQHGLLEPWPLKAQEGEQVLEAKGLLRVSEAKLYALGPEALAEIRNSGGLMLAFAQLFSMQQIHRLALLGAHKNPAQMAAPMLTDAHGILSFANL